MAEDFFLEMFVVKRKPTIVDGIDGSAVGSKVTEKGSAGGFLLTMPYTTVTGPSGRSNPKVEPGGHSDGPTPWRHHSNVGL